MVLCGMVWSVEAYKSYVSVFKYRYLKFWNTVIQKIACKKDIFSVNSGFLDTRLKILTLAPQVVQVTNIRYGCPGNLFNFRLNLSASFQSISHFRLKGGGQKGPFSSHLLS